MHRWSIHVGVDVRHRDASFSNDAKVLATLAREAGYTTELIVGDAATCDRVVSRISDRVAALEPDDLLLVSLSVHGASDGRTDEVLLFPDRNLDDGELEAVLRGADPRARIVLLVDACMSMGISAHAVKPKRAARSSGGAAATPNVAVSLGGLVSLGGRLGEPGPGQASARCEVLELAAAGKGEFAHFGRPACRRGELPLGCFSSAICAVARGEVGEPPRTWKDLHARASAIVASHTFGAQNPSYLCGGACTQRSDCDTCCADVVPFPLS